MESGGAQGGASRRPASGRDGGSRIPSGSAAVTRTAVPETFGEGLPTLPDMAPKNTVQQPSALPFPQLGEPSASGAPANPSQPAAAHTLGVRAAISSGTSARMPAVSVPHTPSADALPAREPTLTARIRAVQPPDVARQAISELGVLARELATLPDALEESRLARTHRAGYFDAANDYLRLARLSWEAVAEERLEQSGADAEYRQRAIVIARRITQLQQECRAAGRNDEFQLPRRAPFLWRRRVGLVNAGLRAWQDRLAPTPDPLAMGRGLFFLRGSLGLAAAGGIWLLLLDLLLGSTLALVALTTVAFALRFAAAIMTGMAVPAVVGWAVATLAAGGVWAVVRRLGARGNASLGLLLGASVWSPARTTRNGRPGSAAVALALRVWWLLVGLLAVPVLLVALIGSGLLVAAVEMPPVATSDAGSMLSFVADALTRAAGPGAAVSLALIILLGLPAVLVALARDAAELAGTPSWVPDARRYALAPTLALVAPVTGALAIALWLASPGDPQRVTLFEIRVGDLPFALTLRAIVLLAALALPYALLVALPFRLGMRRWRRAWLSDLASRRAEVESHVRRLSAADPRSGAQDTSEENLRAMQYDLVLLQFYRDKMAEAAKTRFGPFRLASAAVALLIAVATALLLDPGAAVLARLLGY